jgi:hypothetical protein
MSDRRDDEALEARLSELEETLTALRGELADEGGRTRGPTPALRPPSLREVMRFTERQTIPTLIAILEANVRLLRLAGGALRALDPERSVSEGDGALDSAVAAGGEFSTEQLSSGLADLRDALAGTEATNPEARRLLSEADRLSAEVRERLRAAETDSGPATGERAAGASDESLDRGVSIDVADATEDTEDAADAPEPDVNAELDSIRDEIRGDEDAESETEPEQQDGDEQEDRDDGEGDA